MRLPENELYPFPKAAEPVILPALDDVVSIYVISGDITATSINEDWLSEVMYILMDMEPTSIPSINDSPNVEEYTMINVNCSDGTVKTVFFYEEKGKSKGKLTCYKFSAFKGLRTC